MRDYSTWLIVTLILALYGGWTAFVVSTDRPLDYYTYVIAAEVLVRGENIFTLPEAGYAAVARDLGVTNYAPPYRYPLLTALAVLPLRYLPLRAGAAIWVFGSGLAALGAALLVATGAQHAWQRRAILLAALGFVPIYTTLHAGQVNAFPLLCTAAALYAWGRARQVQTGIWLAIGLWFKPFAIAISALALWRLQWRVFAGIAFACIAIIAVSIPVFGLSLNVAQLDVFTGYQAIAAMAIPTNQSLTGLLARWLTVHEYGAPVFDAPGLLSPVRYAVTAVVGIVLLLLLWRPGPRNVGRVWLEASLLIAATHLLFTQTWYHHLAMLFIPFAVLIRTWESWHTPSIQVVAWAVAYLLIAVHGLFWKQLSGNTLLLDGATWAQVIVLILTGDALRRTRESPSA